MRIFLACRIGDPRRSPKDPFTSSRCRDGTFDTAHPHGPTYCPESLFLQEAFTTLNLRPMTADNRRAERPHHDVRIDSDALARARTALSPRMSRDGDIAVHAVSPSCSPSLRDSNICGASATLGRLASVACRKSAADTYCVQRKTAPRVS